MLGSQNNFPHIKLQTIMKDNPDVDTAVSYKHIKYQLKHHCILGNTTMIKSGYFCRFQSLHYSLFEISIFLFLHYILEYKLIRVEYLQFFYLKFRFFLNKMPYSKISKVAYM
jgi:hypothetical protein